MPRAGSGSSPICAHQLWGHAVPRPSCRHRGLLCGCHLAHSTPEGTLCAWVLGARLWADGDILGWLGGEARPKAHPLIKRQKPEPSLLRRRHTSMLAAGGTECPLTSPPSLPGQSPESQPTCGAPLRVAGISQELDEPHPFISAHTSPSP